MMGLAAWFVAKGVNERFAKPLAVVGLACAAVALLLALWTIYDHFNDKAAVERALTKANAEFSAEQIKAEREAGAAKTARDAADAQSQHELQEKADEAKRTGNSSLDAVWDGLWSEGETGGR